ncbi:4-hydroxy-3-methylbut-2-enyl diphosphate reductase [Streptomyces sp. NPDC001719]
MGKVLVAAPRGFCAGVERAVETVEQVLKRYGPPVYVRKQIVHNTHVVRDLAARGAVFVDELDQVPHGAVVVFSAHGVSPTVRAEATARQLTVIDATCPLVTKVHNEALRFSRAGYDVALIGHAGHEEVEGTVGEAPDRIRIVDSPEDVQELAVRDPGKVVWLSQTTLAVDEVAATALALRERFPHLANPPGDDICYASQNRQDAVRAIAPRCDLVLVAGSANSSNSVRLVEVARRAGAPAAYLIDDAAEACDSWFAHVRIVGVSAGASAPETQVNGLLKALAARGYSEVEYITVTRETQHFSLPVQLRPSPSERLTHSQQQPRLPAGSRSGNPSLPSEE